MTTHFEAAMRRLKHGLSEVYSEVERIERGAHPEMIPPPSGISPLVQIAVGPGQLAGWRAQSMMHAFVIDQIKRERITDFCALGYPDGNPVECTLVRLPSMQGVSFMHGDRVKLAYRSYRTFEDADGGIKKEVRIVGDLDAWSAWCNEMNYQSELEGISTL